MLKSFRELHDDGFRSTQEVNDPNVKKELRKQNPGLDGFLYRWGYTDTLQNRDNKGREEIWETTGHIAPDVYENGIRKFGVDLSS